jgi:hypothetical protein
MRRQSQEQAHESLRFETIGQLPGGLAHEYNNLLGSTALDASLRATELTRSLLASTRQNP